MPTYTIDLRFMPEYEEPTDREHLPILDTAQAFLEQGGISGVTVELAPDQNFALPNVRFSSENGDSITDVVSFYCEEEDDENTFDHYVVQIKEN